MPIYKGDIVPYDGVFVPERNYRKYIDCVSESVICAESFQSIESQKQRNWWAGFGTAMLIALVVGFTTK